MSKSENKLRDKEKKGLAASRQNKDEIRGENTPEPPEIEQAIIEHRREADLDDKTPSGDAGVEDNRDEPRADDPIGESNY